MEYGNCSSFDAYVEGHNEVSRSVHIRDFCRCRIDEILMLTETLEESPFRGQAFQRLPKHMRRRQMSHYIKRLPRRLRNHSFSASKDEIIPPTKRPSRKYRRRPKQLLLEYNRRQRTNVWLESHIWHSKRFKMIAKWGYKLAEKPTNKSFRACYRAATQHCFLYDMSYYCCIELQGKEDKLLAGLQRCTSINNGLTFAAKLYIKGTREGSLIMYHPDCCPYKAIGYVTFIWKPIEENEENRAIWIFSHPRYYNEIVEMFTTLFGLHKLEAEITIQESPLDTSKEEPEKSGEEEEEGDEKKNKKKHKKKMRKKKNKQKKATEANNKELRKEEIKLENKSVPYERAPKYENEDGSLSMTLLKDTINRFRLLGPSSISAVLKAFEVNLPPPPQESETSQVVKENETDLKRTYRETFGDQPEAAAKKPKQDEDSNEDVVELPSTDSFVVENEYIVWWRKYYRDEFRRKCLETQKEFHKSLEKFLSPSNLPPNLVFSLLIKDPRLTLPIKRVKCAPEVQEISELPPINLDVALSHTPLWDSNVRDEVSFTKLTTTEVNEARSRLVVPGSNVACVLPDGKQARVPLIMIQKPGVYPTNNYFDKNGNCSGFDILAPAGWGMPVWLSLVFRGARTGGLNEFEAFMVETKSLKDYFQPDSEAGEQENLEKYHSLKEWYFKHPPTKRLNYAKIGIQSPFYYPWKVLIKDWRVRGRQSRVECLDLKYHVMRDRNKLSALNEIIQDLYKLVKYEDDDFRYRNPFREEELDCLIPICIETYDKGVPKEHAIICLPTVVDMRRYKRKEHCHFEMTLADSNELSRKFLTMEHTRLMKCLKRRRRKERMKKLRENAEKPLSEKLGAEECEQTETKVCSLSPNKVSEEYKEKMETLWLEDPGKMKTVIDFCSRSVMGYVVLGGFSRAKGRGIGLGYVTLRGFLLFLKRCFDEKCEPVVLYRNTVTQLYRRGGVAICSA